MNTFTNRQKAAHNEGVKLLMNTFNCTLEEANEKLLAILNQMAKDLK
jgi:pyruvate-formate lyase-activating enzyme